MDRYEEALERAKKELASCGNGRTKMLKRIFPELKESEDERIRKALIDYFSDFHLQTFAGLGPKKILAWLEKQGEQKSIKEHNACEFCEDRHGCVSPCSMKLIEEEKPVDKVEPRFKEGDWVVYDHRVYQVVELPKEGYINLGLRRNGKIEFAPSTYCRPWTIQDAKDGDVIYSRHNTEGFEWIGIFKSLDKENKRVFFYGFWHDMAKTFSVCRNEAYVLYDDFSPATKEQRDLLFQKMKEMGYEWDAEKKGLERIIDEKQIKKNLQDNNFRRMFEQKSSWSEEDENVLNDIMHNIHFAETNRNVTGSSAMEKEQVNWLKSIKERVGCEADCTTTKEWSEDDDSRLKEVLYYIEYINRTNVTFQQRNLTHLINWLKSLRDRVQPKQEWSKDGENNILFLTSIIEECFKDKEKITLYGDTVGANFTKEDVIDRLKSLRPQDRWKPSEEQMSALKEQCVCKKSTAVGSVLCELFHDLEILVGK